MYQFRSGEKIWGGNRGNQCNESRYEEKDQADYEGEDPGTESFVTVNQPTVLSQTGQTIA